jgi:5-methylcytosine-specific restriction endonuclease McrA
MIGKKRQIKLVGLLIFIGIVTWNSGLIPKVLGLIGRMAFNLLKTTNAKVVISGVVAIVLFMVLRKIWNLIVQIQRRKKIQTAIVTLTPSADREEYIIDRDDYRRGNPKESYYRKTLCLYLLEAFGNSCAKCGSKENGMDIDHFIFSKNEGGCFMMRHREGYLVNNAIPLCQTCNRSKSDKSYKFFFNEGELLTILQKNVLMTKRLNAKSIFHENGKLIKQIKTA